MVFERIFDFFVFAETFTFAVVIMEDASAFPILMALDTKMVIGFASEFTESGAGFHDTLGECDGGWDTVFITLLDGKSGIFLNIFPAGFVGGGRCGGEREAEGNEGKQQGYVHESDCQSVIFLTKTLSIRVASMSTISKSKPHQEKRSPAAGTCSRSCRMSPLKVLCSCPA